MIFSILVLGLAVQAKPAAAKAVKVAKHSKLSTDVKFDGHTVGGKIQAPFESLAVVENEKSIDDLIGVRKDFHDRSEKAKGLR
jgi:hypothetical protein